MTADVIISMIFYMAIAAVTVFLAGKVQLYRQKDNLFLMKVYLVAIFMILFVCSALRFGVGNDYKQYTQTAHEAYVGGYVVTESGFNLLVRAVYTLFGGEYYEIVFALFAFVTLLLFLKAMYEQSTDFSFAFFLFMMLGLYFQTYNTMRYYLALSVALYAMRYVLQRDWIKFVFWVVVAAFFHKSVLLIIPVYWAASYAWKRWQILLIILVSAVCFLGKKYVLKLALLLYPSYENTIYLEGGASLISILRCLAVLALYLWYTRRYESRRQGVLQEGSSKQENCHDRELVFYAQLNFLAVICSVFFSFLPVVTRIVYYFSVSQLLMLPRLVERIQEKEIRKRVKICIYGACILYFAVFLLTAGEEGVGLVPYRSWLFEAERFTYK